jgi:guanine deaminase
MSGPWLLANGLVLASPDQPATRCDIVIDGGSIVAVGDRLDPASFGVVRTLDATSRLVTPGLINTHYHSHDRWDRGRFSPLPLEIWMSLYNPPSVGRSWTPDEIYLRTILGGMELVRGGCTSVMDDVHLGTQLDDASINAVFRAYQDLGIRADVGVAYADLPAHKTIPYLDAVLPDHLKGRGQTVALAPEQMLQSWDALAARWDSRVRSVISISGPQRCSDAFHIAAFDLAERLGRPVLTHVLESRIQAMTGPHFYGHSLVEHMKHLGVLRANAVLIHGVWMSPRDLDLVAQSRAGVSHNPVSNLKLGSGIAPVIAMLQRGIPVGLGTDNHNANDGCSMFEALKWGTLLPTLTADYKHWLTASAGLKMATEHGATLMGKAQEIGRLAPNYAADFLLFDLNDDAFLAMNSPAEQLVFSNSGRGLVSAYVDGEAVLDAGRISTVDEVSIRQEICARMMHMKEKIAAGLPISRELELYLQRAYEMCLADPAMDAVPTCSCCRY